MIRICFEMDLKESFLFRNLPVVRHEGKFIVYDYFSGQIAKVSETDLINNTLPELSFDNTPLPKLPSKDRATITLILNRDCNMRCGYCFAVGGEFKEVIEERHIKAAIDTAVTNDTKELLLTFFGGEPTLCFDRIVYAVAEAEKTRIPTIFAISTNGVMPRKTLDFLISKEFAFNLSMDGPPDIQDKLRPLVGNRPSSKFVENTIERLVESGMSFKVRSTITAETVHDMPRIVEYLASRGVKYIHFEAVNISGRAETEKVTRPEAYDFVEEFKKSCESAKKLGVSIVNGIYTNLINPSIHSCSATTGGKLIVTPEGKISRCYEVQDSRHPFSDQFIVGRYNSLTNSFELDTEKAKRLCERSSETSEKCRDCFAKYICGGGCVMRNLHGLHTSDIREVDDYQCTIIKGLLNDAIVRIWESSIQGEHNDKGS